MFKCFTSNVTEARMRLRKPSKLGRPVTLLPNADRQPFCKRLFYLLHVIYQNPSLLVLHQIHPLIQLVSFSASIEPELQKILQSIWKGGQAMDLRLLTSSFLYGYATLEKRCGDPGMMEV